APNGHPSDRCAGRPCGMDRARVRRRGSGVPQPRWNPTRVDLPRRGVRPPMAPHAHGLGLCPMRERCSTVAGVAVTRLRVDELMYAWFADRDTPMQIGLLGLFDAQPFQHPDGTIEVARVRGELAARAANVAALRRRVVWTRLGEGRPFWVDDPRFDPLDHIDGTVLPTGAEVADW